MGQVSKECDPNPPSVESRYIYVGYIKQEKDLEWGRQRKSAQKKKKKGSSSILEISSLD